MASNISIKESGGLYSTVLEGGIPSQLTAAQQLPWSFLSGSGPFRLVGPSNADFPAVSTVSYASTPGSNGGIGAALNACFTEGFAARVAPGNWDLETPVTQYSPTNGRPTIVGSSHLDCEIRTIANFGSGGVFGGTFKASLGSMAQGHFTLARLADIRFNQQYSAALPSPVATVLANNLAWMNTTGVTVYLTASATGGTLTNAVYTPGNSSETEVWGQPSGTGTNVLLRLISEGFPLLPGDSIALTVSTSTATINATYQPSNAVIDLTTDSWRLGSESSSVTHMVRVVVLGSNGFSTGPTIAGRPCNVLLDGAEDNVLDVVRQLSRGYWCNRMYNGSAQIRGSVIYGLIAAGIQYRLKDTTTLGGGVYLSAGGVPSIQTYLFDGYFDNGVDMAYTTYPFTDAVPVGHKVKFVAPRLSGPSPNAAGTLTAAAVFGGPGLATGSYELDGQLALSNLVANSPIFASSPVLVRGELAFAQVSTLPTSALLAGINAGNLYILVGTQAAKFYNFPESLSSATFGALGAPYVVGIDNRNNVAAPDGLASTLAVSAGNAMQSAVYLGFTRLLCTNAVTGTPSYVLGWTENGASRFATVTAAFTGVAGQYFNGGPFTMRCGTVSPFTGQLIGAFSGSGTVAPQVTVECMILRVG